MSQVQMRSRQVGANIKGARRAAGISRDELASRIDRAVDTVIKYERGLRQPSAVLLVEIADAIGCDVARLLAGTQ